MSQQVDGLEPWGRRRLLRTLVVVSVVAGIGLVGLGYAVYSAVTVSSQPPAAASGPDPNSMASGSQRRDAIASAPMLAVPPEAARAGTPSAEVGPAIAVPPAGRVGPAEVTTGFPNTPRVRWVSWPRSRPPCCRACRSRPRPRCTRRGHGRGRPRPGSGVMKNVQAFLAARAGTKVGPAGPTVVATAVAAQVKGSDGPDWVLACVLLDVRAHDRLDGAGSPTGTANGCSGTDGAVGDRRGHRPVAGAVDVARHRPRPPGRVVHLGQRRPVAERGRDAMNWWDVINPFTDLGNAAGKVVADAWTDGDARRCGTPGCGCCGWCWASRTPSSPRTCASAARCGGVYRYTFWVAGALVLILLMVQLGVAAFRRDGESLARRARRCRPVRHGLGGLGRLRRGWSSPRPAA